MTTKEQVLENLNILASDLVLEVGSGDSPVPRADVLSDKSLEFTPDREGRGIHIDKRPFIIFDAHRIPFKDKSFDYIIARQVLEYIDDPDKFLQELMRVGKRGYIEVTNGLREVIYDWEARKYVVSIDDKGRLLIRRKLAKGPFSNLFSKLKDPYLSEFINKNWSLFNYMFEWDGNIDYIVDEMGIDSVSLSRELNIEFSEYTETLQDKIKMLLRTIWALSPSWLKVIEDLVFRVVSTHGNNKPPVPLGKILKLMACQVCHSEVCFNEDKAIIVCQSCRHIYHCVIKDKKIIPVMME